MRVIIHFIILIYALEYTYFNHNRFNNSKLDKKTSIFNETYSRKRVLFWSIEICVNTYIIYNDTPIYSDVEVVYLAGAVDIHNGLPGLHQM